MSFGAVAGAARPNEGPIGGQHAGSVGRNGSGRAIAAACRSLVQDNPNRSVEEGRIAPPTTTYLR
jgi:hypothetical protein